MIKGLSTLKNTKPKFHEVGHIMEEKWRILYNMSNKLHT